jgi:hypothetical protein
MEKKVLYELVACGPVPSAELETHSLEILSKIRRALDGEFAVHSLHYVGNGAVGIIADLRYGNTYKLTIEVRHEHG